MIFDFKKIAKRLNVTGVIHVGGFIGEELDTYRSCGLNNTILFEPQWEIYKILANKVGDTEACSNYALGDEKKDEAKMYVSSREGGVERGSGASSSLLKPVKHLSEHPEVDFSSITTVDIVTLDWFLRTYYKELMTVVGSLCHNFMNIDVQGYELKVLKGAENTLKQIDGMIIEVNRDETYKDCAKIWEIDDFLEERGFERTDLFWQSESWGDALYERT